MKLLKIKVTGLPLCKDVLEIDFFAKQRVESEKNETMYHLFSNIYLNNAVAIMGINASGKTTILKTISFIINMLNNQPINLIDANDVLKGMKANERVYFETYFYCENNTINKLETVVQKIVEKGDLNSKYIIENEKLWSKNIEKIKTKKTLLEFDNLYPAMNRSRDEEFLMEDVSIIIAFNKKYRAGFFLKDMSGWTAFNFLPLIGEFPEELIAFLDPNIDYLKVDMDGDEVDIRLKFKDNEELILNSPVRLNEFLSSGTIKGIGIFMSAMFVFQRGGYLIIDELENHFNKEIVATLIRFFMDCKVNSNGAALIFSTHYSELMDEFDRNDNIYITRNKKGITVENLSNILKRNDIKKSEAFQSGFLQGTVPAYEAYVNLKNVLMNL